MGLDERMQAKMRGLLRESDDASLTAAERHRKYHEDVAKPASSPTRRTPTQVRVRASYSFGGLAESHTRCWACRTSLFDPGAAFFSCGACGALNGTEPRHARAFETCSCRGACRCASRHGRLTCAASCALMGFVIIQHVRLLLPRIVDAGFAATPTTARHVIFTAVLSIGTVFNFVATMLAGPGTASTELCPLLALGGASLAAGGAAPSSPPRTPRAGADESSRLLPGCAAYCDEDEEEGGRLGSSLSRLVSEWGEQPLRGWRWCAASPRDRAEIAPRSRRSRAEVAPRFASPGPLSPHPGRCCAVTPTSYGRCEELGLSMPPRSHYCRTCKAIVLRMDHHCMFVNGCIGHANLAYFLRLLLYLAVASTYVALAAGYVLSLDYAEWQATPHVLFQGRPVPGANLLHAHAAHAAHGFGSHRVLRSAPSYNSSGVATLSRPELVSAEQLPSALLSVLPLAEARALGATLSSVPPQSHITLALLAATALMACFTATLLVVQALNLLRGTTYIESCRRSPPQEYNLGARANLAAVFGGGRRCWLGVLLLQLLPLPRRPVGDGVRFACRAPARRV